MPLSRNHIIGITCGSCILIIGIVCLVLGLTGFFTFEDPCVGVESFQIESLDFGSGEESSNSILSTLTGGLLQTEVTLTVSVVMEVNNTNSYDLDFKQKDDGILTIPADVNEVDLTEDLQVGTWVVPKATLRKNARNELPVTMTGTVDLASGPATALAASFLTGGPLVFRVTGGVEGSGWLPGLKGDTKFTCFARLDNILALGEGANIRCRLSTRVGSVINTEDEFESQENFWVDEVDPACYV